MKRMGTPMRRGTVKDSLTVQGSERPLPPCRSGRVARLSRGTPPTQFATIHRLAASIRGLQQDAVRIYAPVVDALVRENSCDVRTIEQTLDGLLSFCAYEPALQLYKKLCRHYYTINPAATAEYVHAYREMWDDASLETGR